MLYPTELKDINVVTFLCTPIASRYLKIAKNQFFYSVYIKTLSVLSVYLSPCYRLIREIKHCID